MLYAQAYARFRNCDQPIQPMIYALKRLMISPIEPIKGPAPRTGTTIEHEDMKSPASARDKWKILDYKDYVAEFNDMLIPYLEELFNRKYHLNVLKMMMHASIALSLRYAGESVKSES